MDFDPYVFKKTYKTGTGKDYKYYEMTRDGFCLLAMGFTGKKALQWKLTYIQAFNLMEAKLKEQSSPKQLEENTTIHTKKLTIKADSVNVENLNITNNYIEEKSNCEDMYSGLNFENIPKFKPIHTDDEPKPQKDRTQFYSITWL